MTVRIHIHITHRQHTNGQKTVSAEGTTVGEVLNDLVRNYPGMRPELFDARGGLVRHIEIYLNGVSAFPGELEKPVRDTDEIHVVTFLAGG